MLVYQRVICLLPTCYWDARVLSPSLCLPKSRYRLTMRGKTPFVCHNWEGRPNSYIYINIHIHILYFVILTVFSLASLRLIGYPLVICSHKDSSKETTNPLCCRTLSAIISTWAKNVVKMKQFCLVLNLTLHRGMPCQGTSAALSHIIIAISSNIIIVNNIINTSSQLNE